MLEPLLDFVIGLFVGSYLNVVALRWFKAATDSPHRLKNRSKCPHCGVILTPIELIPIVSFLAQRGRCRRCSHSISLRYPVVELVTALVFSGVIASFGLSFESVLILILASVLFVIALIDLETQLIPDKLTIPAMIGVVVLLLATREPNLLQYGNNIDHWLAGGLIGAGIPALIVGFTKGRGMGLGDIKLGALIGISLGGSLSLVALFFAFVIGALVGLWLVKFSRLGLRSRIPFGPFLVIGWLVAVFWGIGIISWYTGF